MKRSSADFFSWDKRMTFDALNRRHLQNTFWKKRESYYGLSPSELFVQLSCYGGCFHYRYHRLLDGVLTISFMSIRVLKFRITSSMTHSGLISRTREIQNLWIIERLVFSDLPFPLLLMVMMSVYLTSTLSLLMQCSSWKTLVVYLYSRVLFMPHSYFPLHQNFLPWFFTLTLNERLWLP